MNATLAAAAKSTATKTNRMAKKIAVATPNTTALVVGSRAAQGLPPTLEDEAALNQIASLVMLAEKRPVAR